MGSSTRKRYTEMARETEMRPLAAHEMSSGTALDSDDENEENMTPTDKWLRYALHKLHALLWVLLAGTLFWWANLWDVIMTGHPPGKPQLQLNDFFFKIGVTGFCGWLLMAFYLIFYLQYYLKIKVEWEEHWPQAIPIATGCAVTSLIAFSVAIWPIWGWWTLPGIFVLFLGALNSAHFVPI